MEHRSLVSLKNQIASSDSVVVSDGLRSFVKRNGGIEKKKVHFVCTNEWFFKSHFMPLNEAAQSVNNLESTLISKLDEDFGRQERLAIQKHPVNFFRSRILSKFAVRTINSMSQIFRRQQPDIIHLIGLRPIVFGGIAALLAKRSAVVYHLTGTGYLAANKSLWSKVLFGICLKTIALLLKQRNSHLITENEEDLEALRRHGKVYLSKTTILGGAGIDPDTYKAQSVPNNAQVRVAYVGRMIWSKGVDVLVEASKRLEKQNVSAQLHFYGQPDKGNLRNIDENKLRDWSCRPNVTWHGHTDNVVAVWAMTDIAVLPSRGGEGLPRSILEAAACCRPLIVTDVPGCRQFVRDGIEGFIVPPEDPEALAKAIEKLSNDPELRRSMGQAARRRVLEYYTESHVKSSVATIYRRLLGDNKTSSISKSKLIPVDLDIAA